jgi:hypothetical protein
MFTTSPLSCRVDDYKINYFKLCDRAVGHLFAFSGKRRGENRRIVEKTKRQKQAMVLLGGEGMNARRTRNETDYSV